MTETEISKVISLLEKDAPDGVLLKTTFVCYRKAKDGTHQEVNVTILEAGQNMPGNRYIASVATKAGKKTGGQGKSIEEAFLGMNWGDLDK